MITFFVHFYFQLFVHFYIDFNIEHPNEDRKGIYDFKDEATAIEEINKIYVKMSGGIPRPVTEYYNVESGLSFREFNDYINGLDDYKKIK